MEKGVGPQKFRSCFGFPFFVIRAGLLIVVFLLFSNCSRQRAGAPPQGAGGAAPVTVATAVRKTVPVQLNAIGTVQAISTVAVRSQVEGMLVGVHFKEGQEVRRGERLFTIDPRPFQAALRRAEAALARDTVQLENARRDLRRNEELFKSGLLARGPFDQIRTNAEALEATVRADQAAVQNAKLQLGYTRIDAPIDGRTGNLMVNRGNLVRSNDNVPLVTINQLHPIYVAFSVPQQELPQIKEYMAAGPLRVDAVPPTGKAASRGTLTFLNNAVDNATGTIQLKGTFPNDDRALWPGQFVNVTLTLTEEPNAVVIPSQAVQAGQKGSFVFVVKEDLSVDSVPVAVARTVGQEAVIEKGLAPGQRVVTDGQLRLHPGARVEIKEPGAAVASVEKRG